MKLKEAREKIAKVFKTYTYRKGVFTVKRGYYYGMFKSGDILIPEVKTVFPDAVVVNHGNHWHEFCGGAKEGTAKDSYYWLMFTVPSIEKPVPVSEQPALMTGASRRWWKQPVTSADIMSM